MIEDPRFKIRPGFTQEELRRPLQQPSGENPYLRAGVAGAYLPPVRISVPHRMQEGVSGSVSACAAMLLAYHELPADMEPLHELLGGFSAAGIPGRNVTRLAAFGLRAHLPNVLQRYRDGTLQVSRRFRSGPYRLVFRWEEQWLRYLRAALRSSVPPVLFVDLGRLYPQWRGIRQPHAVLLCGGDGRQAWVHDPARPAGPVRLGLSTLMDALLPGEPLAALLYSLEQAQRLEPELERMRL